MLLGGKPTMDTPAPDTFAERLPTEIEIANADHLRTVMAGIINEYDDTKLEVVPQKGARETIVLSPAIAQTFLTVLRLIACGKGFQLIPVNAELSTQQAADLLNVSRPFLIKLLEEGKIPFIKTGRHRRVRADDLFAYKARRDATRSMALSRMASLDSEKGLI
jgi:excisionase family DNA binding protein